MLLFFFFFLSFFQEACGWMMLLQRFISAATTALVAIKPSPLLQRLRVSEFSTIMIVISVTTSTSCLFGDFDVPLHFLLLLIWVMLIADIDFFFLRYQQATMSCHFVIIHTNCKCEKNVLTACGCNTYNPISCEQRKKKHKHFFPIYGTLFYSKADVFLSGTVSPHHFKIHNFKVNGNAPSVLLPTV